MKKATAVCWTLENKVELGRMWGERADPPPEELTPRIGVVHPLNANFMYITVGNRATRHGDGNGARRAYR